MIRIRRAQILTIERTGLETTSDWIVALLREVFPDAAAAPSADLSAGVERQVELAMTYSLEREEHAAIYAVTAWVLGEDFPTRFTSARAVLEAKDLTPEGKVKWLEDWTEMMLETLERHSR